MDTRRRTLVGCGILRKEVEAVVAANGWAMDLHFLESSLHIDFGLLEESLTTRLSAVASANPIVFYGCCHPHMDAIVAQSGGVRTEGQNCMHMLLGTERFVEELDQGAFFLVEDWAQSWDRLTTATFGPHPETIKEIFAGSHKYLLCIRTPCSEDFEAEAESAGRAVGLPLRWLDVELDALESVLRAALTASTEAEGKDSHGR